MLRVNDVLAQWAVGTTLSQLSELLHFLDILYFRSMSKVSASGFLTLQLEMLQ